MDENMNLNESVESAESVEEKVKEETQNVEAPEKIMPTFSENLTNDLSNGLHSVLYKKISKVAISDSRIAKIFEGFLKDVECGKNFRVIDIISAAESVVKNADINENAGNQIYCYDHIKITDKNVASKLLRYSVGGIYSLFAISNGLALDLDAIGSSVPAAESKRYLILPPKKVSKYLEIAKYNNIPLSKAGEIIADSKIYLSRNNEIIAEINKDSFDDDISQSLTIGPEHYASFAQGYNSVCSLALCNCVSYNNLVRFGLGDGIASVCAKALGIYSALTYLKTLPLRMVYSNEGSVSVAASRPNVSDGDYLYLLKLRKDENGLPDKAHYGQLYYYLGEKKRLNIIKDVLPVRENIEKVINRLSGMNMEYVPLAQVPENCFGVIVTVGRGESVNGVKLGYFKGIQ